eukprot:2340328-Alexandrium_andersonii.AAC.1
MTLRGQPCRRNSSLRLARKRSASWSLGGSGRSAQLPSALLAPARGPSAAGGSTTTKGTRSLPTCGVATSPKTSPITRMTPCSQRLPPLRLSDSS